MVTAFSISELESQRKQRYLEFLRVPALSCGLYVLAAGARDEQKPHNEDEVYYVLRGEAHLQAGDEDFPVSAGKIIFVPARVPHKFYGIENELELLVFFAPAESS